MPITRPVDAIVFALPVGDVAMLVDFDATSPPAVGNTAALSSPARPLPVLLQIRFQPGRHGPALQTPYPALFPREQPGATFGFHRVLIPLAADRSTNPQVRKDYEFMQELFVAHQQENLAGPGCFTRHQKDGDRPGVRGWKIADKHCPPASSSILCPAGLLAPLSVDAEFVLASTSSPLRAPILICTSSIRIHRTLRNPLLPR